MAETPGGAGGTNDRFESIHGRPHSKVANRVDLHLKAVLVELGHVVAQGFGLDDEHRLDQRVCVAIDHR